MRALIPILIFFSPALVSGQPLCTYLKNGVTTISSKPVPGAKKLGCLWGESKGTQKRPRRSKRSRPSKNTTAGGPSKGLTKAALRARRYEAFVTEAAETYQLPEALIWAVMKVESHFQPHVVSHKGALGLMQLMPFTAAEMGVEDPFDPWQNIMGGARYLRILANRFDGDTVKMISGYHAGGGAVNRANGIPYRETGEYLRRVLNAYYAYQVRPPTKVK